MGKWVLLTERTHSQEDIRDSRLKCITVRMPRLLIVIHWSRWPWNTYF